MPTHTTSFFLRSSLGVLALSLLLAACPGKITDSKPFFSAREGITIVEGPTPDGSAPEPTQETTTPEITLPETSPDNGLPAGCDPPKIFAASCADSYCHDDVTKSAGLDLKSSGMGARIVGADSTICSGQKLLDPQQPLEGVFWKKINPPAPCGAPMPLGKDALTTEAKECIKAWLQSLKP